MFLLSLSVDLFVMLLLFVSAVAFVYVIDHCVLCLGGRRMALLLVLLCLYCYFRCYVFVVCLFVTIVCSLFYDMLCRCYVLYVIMCFPLLCRCYVFFVLCYVFVIMCYCYVHWLIVIRYFWETGGCYLSIYLSIYLSLSLYIYIYTYIYIYMAAKNPAPDLSSQLKPQDFLCTSV